MISLVYITNRGLYPLTGERFRHLGQYDLLADSLREQTYQDFELMVVDEHNTLPRPELGFLRDRVTFLRPPVTPWSVLRAFSPNTARNVGLKAARAELVLSLDDCVSFGPYLLEAIVSRALGGGYMVPQCVTEDHRALPLHYDKAGGIVAYSRSLALDCGGWEEKYAGCHSVEDWGSTSRWVKAGLHLVHEPRARVTLHQHADRSADYLRCGWCVWGLTDKHAKANLKWSKGEMAFWSAPECGFLVDGKCVVSQQPCLCPMRPSHDVLDLMRSYEAA